MIKDQEFKRKWVDAMRSPKTVKKTGSLGEYDSDVGAVCALGCALRVARQMGMTARDSEKMLYENTSQDERWAIICMNDKENKPLSYIADHIEQNL